MLKSYKLKNGKYIKIDKTTNGYEYSFYQECKLLIDGGIIEKDGLSDQEILKEVLEIINLSEDTEIQEIDEEIEQ